MRTITIHPASLVLGLLLGGVCLLTMSQYTTSMPLRVEYIPHPKDMVQIRSGVPYTVPTGKLFVLTALGAVGNNTLQLAYLRVNGQIEANGTSPSAVNFMEPVASGFTAAAGTVLDVTFSNGIVDPALGQRAWGYLVNQQ